MKECIALKGDKDTWLDFAIKVKKNKQKIWDVLEPFIKEYTNK